MNINLLKKSIALITATSILAACGGGPDKGYNPDIDTKNQISFGDTATTSYTVDESDADENNKYYIDLYDGGMLNGAPLSQYDGTLTITGVSFDGVDGGAEAGVSPPTVLRRTPFAIEDGQLVIDFSQTYTNPENGRVEPWLGDRLRECDSTDQLPRTPAGEPDPDGVHDNPSTITYTISYAVDNGYPAEFVDDPDAPNGRRLAYPGENEITLTLTAEPDPTTDLFAGALELEAGASGQLEITRAPYYACDGAEYTYTTSTPEFASVDANGVVTGISQGTAVISVTHLGSNVTRDFNVVVTDNFKLQVTNAGDDQAELSKIVPACTMGTLNVEPLAKVGENLSGDYTYTWSSADDTVINPNTHAAISDGFGEWALLSPNGGDQTAAGNIASELDWDVSVDYASGDIGTSNAANINTVHVAVGVVENAACWDLNVFSTWDEQPNFTFDHTFGTAQWANLGAGNFNTNALATGAGLTGDDAIQVTVTALPSGDAGTVEGGWEGGVGIRRVDWGHLNDNNLHGFFLGQPSAHGKRVQTSVWVKLDTEATGPIVLKHKMFAWFFTGASTYGGWGRRNAPVNAHFEATLRNTNEWQLVEFTNSITDENYFEVPTAWDGINDASGNPHNAGNRTSVMPEFEIEGLEVGDTVTFDDYGLIITD